MDSARVQLSAQINAVAMVVRKEAGPERFLGTCFAFRHRFIFLTARHNIGDLTAEQLGVLSQGNRFYPLKAVHRHPSIDVAALVGFQADGGLPVTFSALHIFDAAFGLGEEAAAFGFPIGGGTFDEASDVPIPRVFRGHVQRLVKYKSKPEIDPDIAYEMSFASPVGLSGGPLFVPGTDEVFGLMYRNEDSYAAAETVTVQRGEGFVNTTETRRVVSYGMAVALWFHKDWLDEAVPLSGSRLW